MQIDLAYDPREDPELCEEYKETYDLSCGLSSCSYTSHYPTVKASLQAYHCHLIEEHLSKTSFPLPLVRQMQPALASMLRGRPGKKTALPFSEMDIVCTSCSKPTRILPKFLEVHIYHHYLLGIYNR